MASAPPVAARVVRPWGLDPGACASRFLKWRAHDPLPLGQTEGATIHRLSCLVYVLTRLMSDERNPLLSVYLRQRHALTRFLRHRVGCAQAADDLVQETWLRLARGGPLGAVAYPQAYIYRIAANLAIDHVRAQGRQPLTSDEIEHLLNVPDDAPGPGDVAAAASELATLQRALAELPQRRRDILLLSRIEELPHREIAARYGVSTRTVEKELQRALAHCASRLDKIR